MGAAKRIAVIARERPNEALRIAGGLTLADDLVEVFVVGRILDRSAPEVASPLELIEELGLKVYSNAPENGFATVTLDEIAGMLLEYDIVIPY